MRWGNLNQSKINQLQKGVQQFVRRFGALEQHQTPCGFPINVTQAHALQELSNVDKLTQHELSGILGINKSTTSRLVEKLVQKGFVSRDINTENRRQCFIYLTDKGREVNKKITQKRNDKYEKLLGKMDVKEQDQVLNALHILSTSLLELKDEEEKK